MLDTIRRCPYCGRESTADPLAWAENPFCQECVDERLSNAAAGTAPFTLEEDGDYFRVIRGTRTLVANG